MSNNRDLGETIIDAVAEKLSGQLSDTLAEIETAKKHCLEAIAAHANLVDEQFRRLADEMRTANVQTVKEFSTKETERIARFVAQGIASPPPPWEQWRLREMMQEEIEKYFQKTEIASAIQLLNRRTSSVERVVRLLAPAADVTGTENQNSPESKPDPEAPE